MKKYTIRPSISEEALDSWIWTNDECLTSKGFIVIKNPKNKKSIKTFKRTLDENFEKIYNDRHTYKINLSSGNKYLVINEYFRNILGIEKQQELELEIVSASFLQELFKIHWTHPNPTVRIANRATVASILISIVALALTIYSICLTFS
jgi:hypothetical protein